ncbi:MAG: 5-(carboxyamino)imidazole ribonucleotide mutase [Acidobacteriota bacterium]|nr:5-(carboxyamino)imidazole ribonucleotide mutase [Acidobacteriota bacterium]
MSSADPRVGIVMGSKSDWPVVEAARKILDDFGVGSEVRILSAHRTPAQACEWASGARDRGIEVLIGAAGGAAHLPGVVAAHTTLPVIGVPIANGPLSGFDSLLAIVQMPKGIPVATVGVGRADNAALLALQIMATADEAIRAKLADYKVEMARKVGDTDRELQAELS